MSVIIDTTMSEVETVMKYARYGANNCMIGNGWEIKELVLCKDCKFWIDERCEKFQRFTDEDFKDLFLNLDEEESE